MIEAKTVLVTGASRGIGAAILGSFIEEGLEIYGTATSDEGAQTITSRLNEQGVSGSGIKLRVEHTDALNDLAVYFKQSNKSPDIVVNNAGITRDNLLLRMSDKDWQEVIDTNLTSVYRLSKIFIKAMIKKKWGRIINITSVIAESGNAGQANYAAAKAGVAGFARSLAKELGSRNITVNNIAPGFIETDMTKKINEEQRKTLLQNIPLGRFGSANEIGELVRFLASEKAGYITGETIHINGGMYMS